MLLGLIVVVISTDGLPMLRVTGWPASETMDLIHDLHAKTEAP